jgi:hypothetical protein
VGLPQSTVTVVPHSSSGGRYSAYSSDELDDLNIGCDSDTGDRWVHSNFNTETAGEITTSKSQAWNNRDTENNSISSTSDVPPHALPSQTALVMFAAQTALNTGFSCGSEHDMDDLSYAAYSDNEPDDLSIGDELDNLNITSEIAGRMSGGSSENTDLPRGQSSMTTEPADQTAIFQSKAWHDRDTEDDAISSREFPPHTIPSQFASSSSSSERDMDDGYIDDELDDLYLNDELDDLNIACGEIGDWLGSGYSITSTDNQWDEREVDIEVDSFVDLPGDSDADDDMFISPQGADSGTQSPEVVEYNQRACSCTPNDHCPKNSTIGIGAALQIDRACQMLIILNLSFHLYHRYIICRSCESFIPLSRLLKHLKAVHLSLLRDGCSRTASRDFPPVVVHLARSLGISPNQDDIVFEQATLAGPIVGLKVAIHLYWCSRCCHSYSTTGSFGNHRCPGKGNKEPAIRNWGQAPFNYLGGSARHRRYVVVSGPSEDSAVLLPFSASPDGGEIERHIISQDANAFCSKWLHRLGWVVWRDQQISRGFSPLQLFAFAIAPKHRHSPNSGLSNPAMRDEIFDWVGCRILKRIQHMMDEAISWLHSADIELRTDLTAKYKCLFCYT